MTWYRSLYWRIALGVVGFLAAMLIVQAMLFVWAVSQSGRSLPGQSPARLGMTVALDLASVLERDPQSDLGRYVHDQYAQYTHPFFVMLVDGTLITSGSSRVAEPLLGMARAAIQRWTDHPPGRRGERFEGPRLERPLFPGSPDGVDGPGRGGPPPGTPFGGGERFARPAPIIAGGRLAGVVVVPPQAPFGFLLGRFAPMLALVAAGVLIVGAVLTSAMIFGPARRRLRALETAARQLGSGDLTARAPDRGGDEIAAVASAFNAMAGDLSARAEALAASDRVRRQLLADVSHELTTPVTAMRGYLETLTMPELALDEATRARYLTIISDETNRLERLIGELLDLARLDGGGGSLQTARVPVADLFDRVAARHERALQSAGVTLQTTVDPAARDVNGDRDRLEQALQNLAANAIRYAPRGSVLRLSSRAAAGAVVLSVEDAGADGIAAEHLPHIFDRFYKADASRAGVKGGSGLGLSIVKAIVERHGGTISVASRPGRTVFEIVLPAAPG
ncbi:MAG TPA: HAMP domain-containing sensor histidine kinase [Vicinamibacterales bacterium]|nr:HAMP domain-containing sensor histidine kinase [Vicinamibacterales bacterium]